MRPAVTGEKSLQLHEAAVVGRADQDRAAGPGLDQRDAAQDERAHDLFAENRFGDQQGVQLVRIDVQRLDVADRGRIDQRAPAGELAELAGERAGDVIDHGKITPVRVAAGHPHGSRQDHEHAGGRLAGPVDALAGGIVLRHGEAAQALDILGLEDREHLRLARLARRRIRRSSRRGASSVHASSIITSSI